MSIKKTGTKRIIFNILSFLLVGANYVLGEEIISPEIAAEILAAANILLNWIGKRKDHS